MSPCVESRRKSYDASKSTSKSDESSSNPVTGHARLRSAVAVVPDTKLRSQAARSAVRHYYPIAIESFNSNKHTV
jgi:hypothetical protein